MAKKQSGTISKRMARRAEQRRKKRRTQITIAIIVIISLFGAAWVVLQNNSLDQAAASTQGEIVTPLPRNISVATAHELYQSGAFLLDVRTVEEWDDYHIPGTTLIPLDELESRVVEVPQDQEIVVVCRSGNRSQVGRDILFQAGFNNVTSMNGGVNDWRSAGFPIE
jgi:rhodanese-related sulfurtransferase